MKIWMAASREEAMVMTAHSPIQIECHNEGEGDCPCGADLVMLERENGTHVAYVAHNNGCKRVER